VPQTAATQSDQAAVPAAATQQPAPMHATPAPTATAQPAAAEAPAADPATGALLDYLMGA